LRNTRRSIVSEFERDRQRIRAKQHSRGTSTVKAGIASQFCDALEVQQGVRRIKVACPAVDGQTQVRAAQLSGVGKQPGIAH
jgi:hypothetical protein